MNPSESSLHIWNIVFAYIKDLESLSKFRRSWISHLLHCYRVFSYTHREIDFCFLLNRPESDCIYLFPIGLEPNGILFGSKYVEGREVGWFNGRQVDFSVYIMYMFFSMFLLGLHKRLYSIKFKYISFEFCLRAFAAAYGLAGFLMFTMYFLNVRAIIIDHLSYRIKHIIAIRDYENICLKKYNKQ